MDAHTTGNQSRAAGTGTGEPARRFPARLTTGASPALTRVSDARLGRPGTCGGPGALPPARDVALLRAGILAAWPQAPASARRNGGPPVRHLRAGPAPCPGSWRLSCRPGRAASQPPGGAALGGIPPPAPMLARASQEPCCRPYPEVEECP